MYGRSGNNRASIDNWDIMSLQAAKVNGKAMPKVNGSLLQAETKRGRAIATKNILEMQSINDFQLE